LGTDFAFIFQIRGQNEDFFGLKQRKVEGERNTASLSNLNLCCNIALQAVVKAGL
jgi:hypothetical protein